jgi:hypothetical protein
MKKVETQNGEQPKGAKPTLFRACTIAVLAALYGVSIPTFKKLIKPHLKKIGKRIGNLFTTRQILIIVKCIGPPAIVLPW